MNCTCIPDTVRLVEKDIREGVTGSQSISFRAVGNALCLDGATGKARLRYCVEVTGHYMTPTKAGGLKRQRKTISVVANYCPFCGINTTDCGKSFN